MDIVIAVLATTVSGLLVGVEIAVAFVVNPILRGLPFAASIQGRAHAARMLGRIMPFWYFGSVIIAAALVALTWGTPPATTALLGALLFAVSVVLSITLLVPINNRSKTWTAENHPADWREQHKRWDRLHDVRTAIIVTGFVLVVTSGALL
ncbi:MAG: DUF1772 domain-containing protein [Microbacterium sp.]